MNSAVFYPSMVVHIALRFDEAFSSVQLVESMSASDMIEQINLPGPFTPTSKPLIVDGAYSRSMIGPPNPSNNLSQVCNRVPNIASVELPGYRMAGKFDLTFAFRDLPIDPRLVRSAAVEIHLGTVPAASFAAGMRGVDQYGRRRSLLRANVGDVGTGPETLVLAGTVDNWFVHHAANGSTVRIDGRDFRGMLLDSTVDPRLLEKIDLSQPIDKVVGKILDMHPLGAGFRDHIKCDPLDFTGEGGFGPALIPSPSAVGLHPRVRRGARGNAKHIKPAGDTDKHSYWDWITRFCYFVGVIPWFQGNNLMLRPARAIFDVQNKAGSDPRYPTPFSPENGPAGTPRYVDGQTINIRRMVYGRDIEDMTVERKLSGVKAPIVECYSVDTDNTTKGRSAKGKPNQIISAKWPPPAKQKNPATNSGPTATNVAPSGQSTQEEVIRVKVAGVRSEDRLRMIAHAIYEEVGRGEMGGSFRTKSLASFGGDNADPDLVRLRPGDPIELLTDARALSSRSPLVAELIDHERRSESEQVLAVKTALNTSDENIARVIVATARGSIKELQRPFRVANVKFEWSPSGLSIAADYQSYVEVRADAG